MAWRPTSESKPTYGIPYEGIENLRPETLKMRAAFLSWMQRLKGK